MKKYQKHISYIILYHLSIFTSYAYDVVSPAPWLLPEINNNSDNMIAIIIAWLIQITAVLTILAVTWAAIQMMLAVGEEEKMKKARYTMIYAFIGLGVAWLAYGIVTLVTNLNLDWFLL